jgi:predicted  nucleic acid-binding Zn-ribbon protein
MSTFPNKIWDGVTDSRPDLQVVAAPSHNDWRLMLHELVAIQEYILNLTNNIEDMPNLGETISDATAQVREMLVTLDELAPPAELKEDVRRLQRELLDLGENQANLRSGVKKLLLRTRTVEALFKKHQETVTEQVDVIKCGVRNQLAEYEKKMRGDQLKLQIQIDELHDALTSTDI